jgi:serine/threonine-protein kinase
VTSSIERIQAELAGRYKIARAVGRGGMATVYLARDTASGQAVAIKVLRQELSGVLGSGRFHREIRILRRLQHPAIVPVLDASETDSLHYYVMPYVAGESLQSRLAREGALALAPALQIATAVAEALDYAHSRQVLHRDIKPANILLEGERAVVCDFGVARALEIASGDTFSSSGLVLGTPSYMSPEQAAAADEIGPPSDLYALGCVIYEMLTGELPFSGATSQAVLARQIAEPPRPLRTVRGELPEHVDRAVLAALAKSPRARPATGGELVRMLGGARD